MAESKKNFSNILFFTPSSSVFELEMPADECDLRFVIAWLTDNHYYSHMVTHDFYQNSIHKCNAFGSIGIFANGVNLKEPVD